MNISGSNSGQRLCTGSRREFLWQMGAGFAGLALTAMLDGDGFFARNAAAATPELNPLLPRPEHFPAKAKSCIFLFMYGGGSEERRVGEKGRFRGAPDHLKKKKRKKERKLCAG